VTDSNGSIQWDYNQGSGGGAGGTYNGDPSTFDQWAHDWVNGNTNDLNPPGGVTSVPEPETYGMMLAGLGMVAVIARRRKQSA
jgi:hypothetical protein